MRPSLPLALYALLTITACATISQSRFNPLNWFGSSEEVATSTPRDQLPPLVRADRVGQVVEGRALIAQITDLRVDQTPGGAIILATGLAESQGYFNAQLVRRSLENGVLTFDFRAEAPATFQATGSTASRQITAATQLDRAALFGVNTIIVNAQSGSRRVSR